MGTSYMLCTRCESLVHKYSSDDTTPYGFSEMIGLLRFLSCILRKAGIPGHGNTFARYLLLPSLVRINFSSRRAAHACSKLNKKSINDAVSCE